MQNELHVYICWHACMIHHRYGDREQGRASIIQGSVPIFSFFFFVKNRGYRLISIINRD
jgi:hypothetical protein